MSDYVKQLVVDISKQQLSLHTPEQILHYPVSTALKGTGQMHGSGKTPTGRHKVKIKIGQGCPSNTVFVGRRPTGEVFSDQLMQSNPQRDWILSRLIWLTGLESGINRCGKVDTLSRYIYIHGCPDAEPMGIPRSHGCIRMRNDDIISLFELIDNGTEVLIK